MNKKNYNEMIQLQTFVDRYEYLRLGGVIGLSTFGFDRWINQRFYKSQEWKNAREFVITRDEGCDLAIPGYEIYSGLIVHHMNPVTLDNVLHGEESLIDPQYLICTSLKTHNAIHYGDGLLLPRGPVVRKSGDTKLW